MIPGATAADLENLGLVDAFDIMFLDNAAPAEANSAARPAGVTAIVHLLNSIETAQAFIDRGGVPPGEHVRKTERGAGV